MNESPILVDPDWLAARLHHPDVRIFDCTVFRTPQPIGAAKLVSGRPHWLDVHIPGAEHLDLIEDLSAPRLGLPYNLPSESLLTALLSRTGVTRDMTVVLYGAGYLSAVTRAWWVLRAAGLSDVRILDGGWARWVAEGHRVSQERMVLPKSEIVAHHQRDLVSTQSDVLAAIGRHDATLVNALSPEQHVGTAGTHFGRPGRIPTSVNVPSSDVVNASDQRFIPRQQLVQLFENAGLKPDDRLIAYCGGGISATTLMVALAIAGFHRVSLYDGSLMEWAADPSLPMAVGQDHDAAKRP